MIEPARTAGKAVQPEPTRINLLAALLGLAARRSARRRCWSMRDTAMRTESDVMTALALPVLATVPFVEGQRPRAAEARPDCRTGGRRRLGGRGAGRRGLRM